MSLFGPALGLHSYAFFEGGVSGTIPPRRSISLGGVEYIIDTKDYARQSQDTLRDGVVQTGQVDDRLFDVNGAWTRYRYSWHHGAGEELADLREDADPYRFFTSDSLDVWTQNELTLHHSTTTAISAPAADPRAIICGDYVFFAEGANLSRSPATDPPSWTSCTAPGGTIQALATDGTTLYVATSTLTTKYVAAALTPTAFSTPVTGNCTNVAFVANRLLVAVGNVLSEVAAAGTLTTVATHFQIAFTWSTIFSIGSRIYIGGYAGSRSELLTVEVDSTGALAPSQEAAPFLPGEILRTGMGYAGSAIIATSKGVRFAQLGSDGTLTYGGLIDDIGDCRCLVGDGKYVYAGWSAYPGGGSGLARLALNEFVDVLQPAFAADVHTELVTGIVTTVVVVGGLPLFSVGGTALFRTKVDEYQTYGTVDAGKLFFGTVERKGVSSIEVSFAALAAGQSITCLMYNEDEELFASRSLSTVGATSMTVDAGAIVSGWVRVVIELRSSLQSTPTLRRWRLRAYPIVPPVQTWLLPILLASRVSVGLGEGMSVSYDVAAEVERLIDWWSTKQALVFRIGERGFRVRLDGFKQEKVQWSDTGQVLEGTMLVALISV